MHGVAVHIPQLLDALFFREDVEVVVASLPERTLAPPQRDGELDCLDDLVEAGLPRLVHQQVDVLRHDHVSADDEFVLVPDSLQRVFEEVRGFG